MGRSGYSDCDAYDDHDMLRMEGYRQAVRMAIKGKRGQKFLVELGEALDILPEKKLCEEDLQRRDGMSCALGVVGLVRGIDMINMDPEDHHKLSKLFDIAPSLVREIEYENDDDLYGNSVWYPALTPYDKDDPHGHKRKHLKNATGELINDRGLTRTQYQSHQDELRWSRVREWVRENTK